MPEPDLKNIKVMVPRVRRSLEGPTASASAVVGTLSDDQYIALIADAVAEIILYTGGLFGHTLVVEQRDDEYGAPTAWTTSEELTESEITLVVNQAALNYFFQQWKDLKISERISNEAQEWEWSRSANLLLEQLKSLRSARDAAIAAIEGIHAVADEYVNLLGVRDAYVDAQIEPWAGGAVGGTDLARFGDPSL